jgi:imidazoleglycerol phosphate dehydratase HisB|tara:strand:+ start:20 stop:346 length:327 start_codon:yes stop_codon:yes gene_type:complete
MAQDFERNIANGVGTGETTLRTADSDDAIVGIMISNVTTSQINVEVYITVSSVDHHLVKDAPIPVGSSLQVLDGGAKIVMQSGDALKVKSDTASSADVWVSVVDAIST